MFFKNLLFKIKRLLTHPTQIKLSTGLLRWVHRLLATLGLATVIVVGIVASQELLQYEFEINALRWLTQRYHARLVDEGNILEQIQDYKASQRVAAIDPKSLNRPQALTAKWLKELREGGTKNDPLKKPCRVEKSASHIPRPSPPLLKRWPLAPAVALPWPSAPPGRPRSARPMSFARAC
jgi:hypothetical protein